MKAKIRGTEIYFDCAGMQLAPQGKGFVERPVLFMLHGGPGGDHLRYKQHSLELADVAQLVFVDHRGCGRSKKTKQKDYTLENNIEDLEALRQHLGLEKISILGTSYGGMVAQGYALRYPQRLEKLVLVVTAPSYRFMEEAKQKVEAVGTPAQKAICQHLWNGSFKNQKQLMAFFRLMDPLYSLTSKAKRAAFGESQTEWSYQAVNEGFGGFLQEFDFVPQLKKIKCPTLVLAGKEDWITSYKQSKIIAEKIPHSRLKIFNKSGHSVAIDAHEEYIKEVKRFLR